MSLSDEIPSLSVFCIIYRGKMTLRTYLCVLRTKCTINDLMLYNTFEVEALIICWTSVGRGSINKDYILDFGSLFVVIDK